MFNIRKKKFFKCTKKFCSKLENTLKILRSNFFNFIRDRGCGPKKFQLICIQTNTECVSSFSHFGGVQLAQLGWCRQF